jgi:glycosyltransferase involved in cell wall biosynthesis
MPRPRRVANLIHTMAHGGVETALINWTRSFDRARVEPHLVCFRNPGGTEQPFVDAASHAGLDVSLVTWARRKPVLKAAREVAAYVRAHGIELLHCHNTYANLVGLAAARLTPVRTMTTTYVWSKVGFKRRVLQWVDARALRCFDQVTAHCRQALEDTSRYGIPAGAIRLLECGFDAQPAVLSPAERVEGRAAYGAGSKDIVLIKVARFWPEKRHDVMLRAMRALVDAGAPVKLWLPGVGPELAATEGLARELRLSDHVRFPGFCSDLPQLLALADIQVHSSDEEGVPLAILSGMAAALPIVATRVGGLAEVLRHDDSGVLVPRRQPAALASAVIGLIEDAPRRQALGSRAQQFIDDEYSLAAATARVESVYEEVLSR